MKKAILKHLLLAAGLLFVVSCSKDALVQPDATVPSAEALAQIEALGFSTEDVLVEEGGYIVEGDIFLTEENLRRAPWKEMRVPGAEQYHTFNLVTGVPRTIYISVDSKLPSYILSATQAAVDRYNAENLSLTFTLLSGNSGGDDGGGGKGNNGKGGGRPGQGPSSATVAGADIVIVPAPRRAQYLASAGFPTSTGDPFGEIKVAERYFSENTNPGTLASIMAHEIGHCIGFRHTDWFNRSISCGGSAVNEGQSNSGVGAVHIPGTPTGATRNAGSWMLSCIGSGDNRPFNNDDKTALEYLY